VLHFKWLAKEATISRLIIVRWSHLSGDENNLYGWPTIMDGVGQLQAIHSAGHLNVGKQKRYIGARFQNGKCFVGVYRLNCLEARVFDDVDCPHSQHHFVFDDKNIRGD